MFDSFWMTIRSLVELPSINCLYELINKNKNSTATKLQVVNFDFFLPGDLGLASYLCQMKDH